MNLTPRQQSVLDFIRKFQEQNGISPTVREICGYLGLKGTAGVHRVLQVLIENGCLISEPGKNRSWRLSEGPPRKSMPIFGTIAAGAPIEAIENRETKLPIDPAVFGKEDCFALRVKGDSMIDAHILDGDLAVIRPQTRVENGEIAAVIVQDYMPEATLKIVRRTRSSLTLVPANSSHAALVFKGPQRKQVTILGKFVGIVRGV